jgi:hypothetical protein
MEDDCIKRFQILLPRFARLLRVGTAFTPMFKLLRSPGVDLAGWPVQQPIPTRFLAPIDCSKIPAQNGAEINKRANLLGWKVLFCLGYTDLDLLIS